MESSPAQRLMNRRTRTLLPTMKTVLQPRAPHSERDIQQLNKRQFHQSRYYNQHACDLFSLEEGDVVCMKPFQLWSKEWKKGMIDIILRLGERSYLVETPNGDTYRRNRYHLRKTKENPDPKEVSDITPCRSPEDQPTPAGPKLLSSPATAEKTTDNKTTIAPKTAAMPQCIGRPPQYLKDYVLKWLDMIKGHAIV